MCLDGRGESVFYCALHNKKRMAGEVMGARRILFAAPPLLGTPYRNDVAAYVLPRVRLCTRRSPVAAHIVPLRRPRKCY